MKKGISLVLVLVLWLSLCAFGAEKQTVEINYGEEYTIELKNQQKGIVWETDNPDIVTVQNGIVTGIAPGNAIVTATKDGKSVAEISFTVKLIDISIILFSQKNVEIELDESMQLHYMIMPDNASDYGVSWKSANPKIVEVDDNGNIHAVAPGTTTIVCCTPNGLIDTCEVAVKEPSAIEQLNEDEKLLFDVMVEKVLPSFYNAPAVRIRKIEDIKKDEDHTNGMVLAVSMQGTNRLGGTLFKDYMIVCSKDMSKSSYLPCFTDDGLFDKSKGWDYIESTKLDYTKINAALEEYWNNTTH